MSSLVLRHGWLQKHPTPTAATGEFHWHPAGALGGAPAGDLAQASVAAARGSAAALPVLDDRGDLRLSLVDRLRGVAPPAALWQLAPGRVVWAQVFAATAPGDGRRYCGLAVTIAEADGATAADLLASLVVPPAGPWSGEPAERAVELVRARPAPLSPTRRAHRDAILPAPVGVVRALISGGVAAVEDPARPDLPAWIASLEAWLPPALVARPRQGEWRGGGPRIADATDPVADAVIAAWCPPDDVSPARTRRAWAALNELAASQARGLDAVAAEVRDPDGALHRALRRDELARLAEPAGVEPWLHAIHHWGRGRLPLDPRLRSAADAPALVVAGADPTLVVRLADLVIARALADHAGSGADHAAIDRVRWHALLPAARRRELLAMVAARAPSLAELIDRVPARRAAASRHTDREANRA